MSQSVIRGILYLIGQMKKTIVLTDHMTNKRIIHIQNALQTSKNSTEN